MLVIKFGRTSAAVMCFALNISHCRMTRFGISSFEVKEKHDVVGLKDVFVRSLVGQFGRWVGRFLVVSDI